YKPRYGGAVEIPIIPDQSKAGGTEFVCADRYYALTSGYVNGFGPYGIMQADPNGSRWRKLAAAPYKLLRAHETVPYTPN
ncbi:hypothetical protein, partial [Sphingobacterium daejeonense]|uniref:hypothetical protein n=1 Tax=Sphingobacterium daejeonense TaxID=371142 RepID=UPI003D31EF98